TGGREREIVRLDHGGDPVVEDRMLDPGAPGGLGEGRAPHADVAACVDRVVGDPVCLAELAAAVYRPALHESRRVDLEQRGVTRVEVAPGLLAQLVAAGEDPPDVRMAVADVELAPVQPADLAALLVGAESLVDLAEPVEELVEHRSATVVADVDDDRHPHD